MIARWICRWRLAYDRNQWVLGGRNQGIFKRFQFFQTAGGAERDAGQRIVGDGDRQTRGGPQHVVEIAEQRTPAGQHDPLVDDIGGQLRRGVLERDLDRFDDGADRLGERLGDLALGEALSN